MGLSPMYDLLYRPMCWFVHSAPIVYRQYLRESGTRLLFDSQPSHPAEDDQLAMARKLFSAVPISLIEVLALVDTVYALGRQS